MMIVMSISALAAHCLFVLTPVFNMRRILPIHSFNIMYEVPTNGALVAM
jgi:hypothetical protein